MFRSSMLEADQRTARALANVRLRYLGLLRGLAIILVALSFASVGIGFAAVVMTDPYYYFPYSSGTGVIQGVLCLIFALLSMCIASEGRKTPEHPRARTTSRLRNLVCTLHFLAAFTLMSLFFGLGFSGIGAVSECKGKSNEDGPDRCVPNKQTNLALGAIIIALSSVLLICFFTVWGIVLCNNRAFGSKPNMDNAYQVERLSPRDFEDEVHEFDNRGRSNRVDLERNVDFINMGYGDNVAMDSGETGQYRHQNIPNQENVKKDKTCTENKFKTEDGAASYNRDSRFADRQCFPHPSAPPEPSAGASYQFDNRVTLEQPPPPSYIEATQKDWGGDEGLK